MLLIRNPPSFCKFHCSLQRKVQGTPSLQTNTKRRDGGTGTPIATTQPTATNSNQQQPAGRNALVMNWYIVGSAYTALASAHSVMKARIGAERRKWGRTTGRVRVYLSVPCLRRTECRYLRREPARHIPRCEHSWLAVPTATKQNDGRSVTRCLNSLLSLQTPRTDNTNHNAVPRSRFWRISTVYLSKDRLSFLLKLRLRSLM
jgi:hypothetical protein